MKKRKWVYVQPPSAYGVSCNLCGGEVQWSEYRRKVWCWRCLKDVPGTPGLFGGPIAIEVCEMLGVCLDKIDLATGKRLYIKIKGSDVIWEKEK